MANEFSKEEIVAFEEICEGFNDALVLSQNVSKYNTDSTGMERANDTIWRPQPYIAQSHDGTDATDNFTDAVQLSVPSTLGYQKHSTAILSAEQLRDQLQEGRLGQAAYQKLASDINVSIMNVAAQQGTLTVPIAATTGDFNDVAECDSIMNEQGVMDYDRYLALSSRDYNGIAGDLADRQTLTGKTLTAYERASVGMVSSFDTYKLGYANRIAAAAGTTVTFNGADQYYTPAATSTATTGEKSNVDNRYQTVTLAVGGGTVAVGDAFTTVGVNAVHHITKVDTGELKTHRIIEVLTGGGGSGTFKISPPIVSGEGGTDAELAYQNVTATPADGAALVFLNTTAAPINPFWFKDAFEILPGNYEVPTDAGASVMRATTENGIEIVMTKQFDINTFKTKYRWDIFYGVVCKQPEMAGILLFGQV